MRQIHQLVPALHDGDAIGDSARAIRDFLRAKGFSSDIYAYTIDESLGGEALYFANQQLSMQEQDILVYHYALPSGMSDFVKRSACKKALIYHNITPSYYWLSYDPSLLHLASAGRRELESLAPFLDRSAGDSEFNRLELQELHFRNTCVLPIYVKEERYRVQPSPFITGAMNDGCFNFLFVGRVAPNKKLEDVLTLLHFYRRCYSQLSRVIFVGKTNVTPPYHNALRERTARLGIMPDDVVFTGHVDWPELVAYYKSAHVFVSMSEHEGFCVPLVEAMICELPIVAYASTAVPYTLGKAGIQFTERNFLELAAVCHRLKEDSVFRESVLKTQREQLKHYTRDAVERSVEEFLAPLL
ncbi:MAG TPA: glycosyltransferase [Acidobacteriota bacterium]|nr:glycosyltransferase [Acidobacteriota bacterium]